MIASRRRLFEALRRCLSKGPAAFWRRGASTIAFDSLELVAKLKTAGFAQEYAAVRVIADIQQDLVTRTYLDQALQPALASIRTEIALRKWAPSLSPPNAVEAPSSTPSGPVAEKTPLPRAQVVDEVMIEACKRMMGGLVALIGEGLFA